MGNVSQIYVGAPIDVASERNALARVVRTLEGQAVAFVVLANIHLGGRQVDLVIATARGLWVVEVKSSHLPIRGGINGVWSRREATGEWRGFTNAYLQALDAKNAVRDAMSAQKTVGAFYPSGQVVFTGGIPQGSEVTVGDFKVGVSAIEALLPQLAGDGSSPWSLDDWRTFAVNHSLTPVSLTEAIATKADRERQTLLSRYGSAFISEYEKAGGAWQHESSEQRGGLLEAVKSGPGLVIAGPSGCGKTLLAKWLAVELVREGHPTIFLNAKDFAGSWAAVIRKEAALLVEDPLPDLLRAFALSETTPVIVVDGVNELGAYHASGLRGVGALSRRLNARLIVTAQERTLEPLAGLSPASIDRPSIGLKRRIAEASGGPLPAVAVDALKAVSSGIEADIVGQIGNALRANATRLALLDQYMRMRLGDHARQASFGLRRFASVLHDQIAFSWSETVFDEFMRTERIEFDDVDAMFRARLLVRRAGRVSFAHEMMLNACAAHDIAARAAAGPADFGARLTTPYLEPLAGDVIAAIEDGAVARTLLANVTRADLLSSAAEGAFGAVPRSATKALLASAARSCREEIVTARLVLHTDERAARVAWEPESVGGWTDAERAQLSAIGLLADSGADVDTYLDLCAVIDHRLVVERRRLADAAHEARFALRDQSFALAYYGLGEKIGFSYAASASRRTLRDSAHAIRRPVLSNLSSGQLLYYLDHRRDFFDHQPGAFADELLSLFRDRFWKEPYHVQLAMLDGLGFAREAPPETLRQLVEIIETIGAASTNWGINSSIIDALKMLGALDQDGEDNRAEIRRELASVTGEDDATADVELAFSLYSRMFDHPYDSIYAEEIFALDEEKQRRLYRRALSAYRSPFYVGEAWLAGKVAEYGDPADIPLFQHFAGLPDPNNPMAQDEWTTFILATRFLGRHGGALPAAQVSTAADRCLLRIRTLLYAIESPREEIREAARSAWRELDGMPTGLVIGCLGEANGFLVGAWALAESAPSYPRQSLADWYADDCLRLARRFLEADADAQYFHNVPWQNEGPEFAFGVIGRHGDRSDVEMLRRFSRAHRHAKFALAALRTLDSLGSTPTV